jgi:hypothetical protein
MSGVARLFLEITTGKRTALYNLLPLDPDKRVCTRAWRLWRNGKHFYDVSISNEGWISCTCPDATFRGRVCKHASALRAAGLLPKEK